MTNSSPHHIAIPGAGLLGRLLAWQLLQSGCKVTLFEAGSFTPNQPQTDRAAAFTAAGMIAPLSEAVVSDEGVYRMGQFALTQWPQWLATLNAPASLFFQRGSLVIAHPQDLSELEQFERELKFVIPQCKSYHRLNQQQIQELEPDLNPNFAQGLFLAEEGHINNRELLTAIGHEIIALGVNLREFTKVNVAAHKIITENSEENFDLVIDCRGFGAKSQDTKLRGVRGETLHVETKEIQLSRPVRLMHPRYQLYIVPKPNHRFMIGATQIESEDRSPITLQSSLELSSALYTLSPAFAEARIIEMDTNLRPAYMDNLPRVKIQNGLITANGLFRHGYLLAPAVVENILAHILKKPELVFTELLN
ncbi:glycine oxidase ThiO [Cellvibrio zantedeschiae]|uniref:D-amino-acid oxidase n=1 Tax=Cellvibrio zantedeschiae TaxID=1237077 RepID=A0ABQ3AX95_9GAMM|nr:glycine oxidase ThiO [Cellvibrio zantedeschiae]GGY67043.1 glycine oxidase ThiO [Cellvibrio zantedeschiae]